MQPLVSPVDYESRHTSYRAEDERLVDQQSETIPLLQRFPPESVHAEDRRARLVVGLLLAVLVAGVVIGTYLLVLQSRSENILPPVDNPLNMLRYPKRRVRAVESTGGAVSDPASGASRVVLVQTDTRQCDDYEQCTNLLRDMQRSLVGSKLPYDWVVSGGGAAWQVVGGAIRTAIVIALAGNFTERPPPVAQVAATHELISELVKRRLLRPAYVLFGRSAVHRPTHMFRAFNSSPHWDERLSE